MSTTITYVAARKDPSSFSQLRPSPYPTPRTAAPLSNDPTGAPERRDYGDLTEIDGPAHDRQGHSASTSMGGGGPKR